jgi:hypothetical protein
VTRPRVGAGFSDEKRAKNGRAVGVVGVALFARVGVAVTLGDPRRPHSRARPPARTSSVARRRPRRVVALEARDRRGANAGVARNAARESTTRMAGSKKKSAAAAATAQKATAGGATKYEDMFEVIDRDPDGKKFDRVSRYKCRSEFDAELTIDVNVDAYPLTVGQRFSLALAPTLSLDGTPEDDAFDQSGKPSLADGYEYVMYGKCYKKVDENAGGLTRASAYISFGGLLMNLKADPKNLQEIEIDDRIYLLMRAV